jgi:hypothetical protein
MNRDLSVLLFPNNICVRKQQEHYLLSLDFFNSRKGYNVFSVHVVIKLGDEVKISVKYTENTQGMFF